MTRDHAGAAKQTGKLWLYILIVALGNGPSAAGQWPEGKGDPLPPGVRARMGLLRLRHGARIASAVFSPNGKTLASVGDDNLVRLWDAASGKELRRFTGHSWPVLSALFSADGKTLVSAGRDGTVRFWEVATARELRQFKQPEREFNHLRLSPDGGTLAVSSCSPFGIDGVVHILDLPSGRQLRQIKAYARDRIVALAFSSNGKAIVSAPTSQGLHLWEVATGKQVRRFEVKRALISDVAFCGDGKTLVGLSGLTGTLLSWDLATGKVLRRVESRIDEIRGSLLSFAMLPSGRTLLALRLGSGLATYDAVTLKELRRFGPPEDAARELLLSPDGKTVAFLAVDNAILLARADSGEPFGPRGGHWAAVRSLACSADGKLLVSAGDNTPVVWDAATGKELHRLRGHRGHVDFVAFLPDGRTLVSGSRDGLVCFWEAATGKELRRYQALEQLHAVSPDGKLLAALTRGSGRQTLCLRDTATGKELRRLPFPEGQGTLSALVFSPDSRTLVVGPGLARKINRWHVASGKELAPFERPPRPRTFDVSGVRSLAFSPDGKVLASVHHDGVVRLWDAETGATLRDLEYPGRDVNLVTFSPDGKVLAVAIKDFVVLVERITGKERVRLRGHQGRVTGLAFSPDGKLLLTGSADTTALVWDLARAAR